VWEPRQGGRSGRVFILGSEEKKQNRLNPIRGILGEQAFILQGEGARLGLIDIYRRTDLERAAGRHGIRGSFVGGAGRILH